MKKWMYLIFPGLMLGIFLVFYLSSVKRWDAQEAEKQRVAQEQKAADDKKKADAEEAARVAAQKRQEEQKQEEAKKAADREAKYQKQLGDFTSARDKANAHADQLNKEISELGVELDSLHRKKEQDNQDDFDLLKQVELARVKQRDAELEIQRMVAMIAQRASESAMANPPPAPAPVEK